LNEITLRMQFTCRRS